jgi:hypothetical protein
MTRDLHGRIYAVELALLGILALAAVFLPLEAAVFAGGPMLAVVSLLYAGSKALHGQRGLAVPFGIAGIVLGVFLATHDYIFVGATAILVHLCVSLCILGLAAFQGITLTARPAV